MYREIRNVHQFGKNNGFLPIYLCTHTNRTRKDHVFELERTVLIIIGANDAS